MSSAIFVAMPPTLLAIETSCDETSAAVLRDGKILSNIIASQSEHERWGGVVPELASRAHEQKIVAVVEQSLTIAGIKKEELSAIAVTQGPGLIGSLMVGVSFAKAFALGLNVPLIAVNHLHAHLLSVLADEKKPEFPFLCLTVSGGHTMLVLVKSPLEFEVLGTTRDDAAGEAFDKCSKMLGLSYPGGPLLDKLAPAGDSSYFKFAEPQAPEFDFSFSGLKTSVLYFLEKEKKKNENFIAENLSNLCASVQEAIVNCLVKKLEAAAKKLTVSEIALAGGVSANSGLRKKVFAVAGENGWQIFVPPFELCTDNAAMIGIVAHYKFLAGEFADQSLVPRARFPLQTIQS